MAKLEMHLNFNLDFRDLNVSVLHVEEMFSILIWTLTISTTGLKPWSHYFLCTSNETTAVYLHNMVVPY